jgi:hypothetical protein
MLKYIRLVDVSLGLFGKSYCYLSNQDYAKRRNIILDQPVHEDLESVGNDALQKFVISNAISPVQIISAGLNETDKCI